MACSPHLNKTMHFFFGLEKRPVTEEKGRATGTAGALGSHKSKELGCCMLQPTSDVGFGEVQGGHVSQRLKLSNAVVAERYNRDRKRE